MIPTFYIHFLIGLFVAAGLVALNWTKVRSFLDNTHPELGVGFTWSFLVISVIWGVVSFSNQGTFVSLLADTLMAVFTAFSLVGIIVRVSFAPKPSSQPDPSPSDTSVEDKIEELLKNNKR